MKIMSKLISDCLDRHQLSIFVLPVHIQGVSYLDLRMEAPERRVLALKY